LIWAITHPVGYGVLVMEGSIITHPQMKFGLAGKTNRRISNLAGRNSVDFI
jgi:hypothetical protein